MSQRVDDAVESVRKVKTAVLAPLGGDEYNEVLEGLIAEAEAWEIELKQRKGIEDEEEPESDEEDDGDDPDDEEDDSDEESEEEDEK